MKEYNAHNALEDIRLTKVLFDLLMGNKLTRLWNEDNPLVLSGEKEGSTVKDLLEDRNYIKRLLRIPNRILKNKNIKLIHAFVNLEYRRIYRFECE